MLKERFPKELTDFDSDAKLYLRRSARLISQSHATEPSDQKPVTGLLHLEDTLSAAELATRLRMSVKTIYSYASRGIIPHRRIELNVLFLESEIAQWLETKTFRRKPAEQDHDTPKTVDHDAPHIKRIPPSSDPAGRVDKSTTHLRSFFSPNPTGVRP